MAQTALPDDTLQTIETDKGITVRNSKLQTWSPAPTAAITARLATPSDPIGCAATDFASFPAGAVALIQRTPQGIQIDTLSLLFPILMIPCVLWMIYQIIDWSNDVFQVTADQIIDLDRTPFGTEERRSAQLENILATEYRREGIIGHLFNFGSVYITVGGTQL